MVKKILTAYDFAKNEIQNPTIGNLASAPSSPVKGQMYFNTTDNIMYWWDGGSWVAAKAPSTSGITQAEGDARYVMLTGATPMTGALQINHDTASRVNFATSGGSNNGYVGGNATDTFLNTPAGRNVRLQVNGTNVLSVGATGITAAQPVTLAADPSTSLQAATKQYVDNVVAGLNWKASVRAASTGNVTLATPGTTLDGVTLVANDRVLLKNQSTGSQNGIYVWTASGSALTRALDANTDAEMQGAAVWVNEGATHGDQAWTMTTSPMTIDSTAQVWAQFGAGTAYVAGAGLALSGSTFNVGVSGGGLVANADDIAVATNGISNSMLATMAANTIKMNNTAGVAAPTDVTIAAAQTALAIPALPVTVANGGTGRATATTAYGLIAAGTTATGAQQTINPGTSGQFLKSGGASALGAFANITTADVTGLDTTLTAKTGKYTQATVGGATSQVITHNLNTQSVVVSVWRTLTPWDEIECDIEHTSVNTITLRFTTAPAVNEYSVTVIG